MSNVLIVYGSTTGNTADIAEYLGGRLRAAVACVLRISGK